MDGREKAFVRSNRRRVLDGGLRGRRSTSGGISWDQSDERCSQRRRRRAFNRCALINSTILGGRAGVLTGRSTRRRAGVAARRMSPRRCPAAALQQGPDDSTTVSVTHSARRTPLLCRRRQRARDVRSALSEASTGQS